MKRKFLTAAMTVLTVAALCVGCGSQETKQGQTAQSQNGSENKQQLAVQEKESYTARRYELPYTKNSSELDRIQEMSIGMSTTEEGDLEGQR